MQALKACEHLVSHFQCPHCEFTTWCMIDAETHYSTLHSACDSAVFEDADVGERPVARCLAVFEY